MDHDAVERELGEIVAAQRRKVESGNAPIHTVEQLIEYLRDLPDVGVDVLLFSVATDYETGKISAKFAAIGNEPMIAEAAKLWLEQRGYVKGTNPLLDSLRGLLPPGHPLK